jgi:hypothetical protein
MNFEICQYLNLKDQLRFALVDKRTWNQITTNMFTSLGRLFAIEPENKTMISDFLQLSYECKHYKEQRFFPTDCDGQLVRCFNCKDLICKTHNCGCVSFAWP